MDEEKNNDQKFDEVKSDIDLGASMEEEVPTQSPQQDTSFAPKKDNWFKRTWRTKKGKALYIFGALLFIVAVLYAIPASRYGILGLVLKKDASLAIVDAQTKKPVTQATVELAGLSAKTDSDGNVTLKDVPVGEYQAKVTKKNYKDADTSYAVPIFTASQQTTISLEATGRQVVVTLTNSISKKPIENATLTVDEVTAITDEKGEANLVLPADKPTVKASVTRTDYNTAELDIAVTDQAEVNKLTLTPAGSVYYLSKATGKINVMKANLDGSSASVVVEATGNENDRETVLLSARDWQYMVLSAKRKSNIAGQLYVIDAKTNTLKTVDEGNVSIQLVGWSDHDFLYIVTRNDKKEWEEKRQALKSYNADTGKIAVIDETSGTGSAFINAEYETFGLPYIIEGKVLYTKAVSRGVGAPRAKKPAIMVATVGNGQTQRVKEFDSTKYASIDAKLYEPQEVYFRIDIDGGTPTYYEYEASGLKTVTNNDTKFYETYYPTYLISPNGQKSFWDEPRNGKNALFVGDKNGSNSTELAQQSEYTAYGWMTDGYVLLAKNGSELYVAAADQSIDQPVKITNYHKPAQSFPGYGYGYGGR